MSQWHSPFIREGESPLGFVDVEPKGNEKSSRQQKYIPTLLSLNSTVSLIQYLENSSFLCFRPQDYITDPNETNKKTSD